MKKPGTALDLLLRGWVPIEVRDLAMPGTGHARGLRPCGSRDRLRRLSDQAARWFGIGKNMVSSTLRAGSEAHTTPGSNSSLTRGHHPHPPSPCSRQRARGGRVSISCAVTYGGNVGKALCAKQPNSRIFCKIPYPSGHHPHSPSPCSRQRARGGRVSISCAVTYVGNLGKALCAKQPNSRIFCKIHYPLRLAASSALIHGPM